jgi:hypothetical protein
MTDKVAFRPYGSELPEGIKNLHGCTYLVKFDMLQLPDPEAIPAEQYEFKNPRSLTERGQQDLFDKQKNADLRNSIKEKTLMQPFICRWKRIGDKVSIQMVGGERRHRAISYLIHKKELVKDPTTARLNDVLEYEYDFNSADKVYEYVVCQIYACKDDIEALSLAYTENDCRVNQGPGHDIAVVMELRRYGANDEKIMATMSKDEKWLRDTDKLIADLPADCLKSLIEDHIDREAALEILTIKEKYGEETACKALEVANLASARDYKKKFDQLTSKILEAREQEEIAEGDVVDAQFHNDEEAEQEAKKTVEAAQAKVKRLASERQKTKQTTDRNQVRDGFKTVTNTTKPRPTTLRGPKIEECYIAPLQNLVGMGGRNRDHDYLAPTDALNLAIKLCRGIMSGDADCMEIVRLHYKKISINAEPDIQDDEPDDDENN